MRRRLGEALRIGLAPGGMALAKTHRWQRSRVTLLAEYRSGSTADWLDAAFNEAGRHVGKGAWPVTVVLADDLARLWPVTPPPAATRMADLEAAAAVRFQSLFGTSPASWKVAADWDTARPFLAAAVPAALIERLEQLAIQHRFHLVEIVPQFIAALNQWRRQRRPGAWFGMVHGAVLTIAAYDGATLGAVRTTPVPAGASRTWLDTVIARESLSLCLATPTHLQLCGALPDLWLGQSVEDGYSCSRLGSADFPSDADSDLLRLALTGGPA